MFWTLETTVWVLVIFWLTARTAGSVLIANVFWKQEVSKGPYSGDKTHVEDLKHLVQVQPPGGDLFLVGLGMQVSRNPVSFSLLDDIPSDLRYGPGVK